MHFSLVMLKMSFSHIFQYKLGFSEIPLPQNKMKKNIQGSRFALGNIPNHKIDALRITKNHMTFWYGGCTGSLPGSQTKGVTTTFWGQNNIKNEISTIKLLRVQIFSKIQQLLKNHYLWGVNIFGVKNAPQGAN